MSLDTQPVAHIRCLTASKLIGATWTSIICGTTALDGRKEIIIFNRSPHKLFWSFQSTSDVRECNALKAGGYLSLNLSDAIPLYLRCRTVPVRVIVNELA
jgi:hypothetical protein